MLPAIIHDIIGKMDVALDDQENIRFEGSTKYDEGTFGFARRDDKIYLRMYFLCAAEFF